MSVDAARSSVLPVPASATAEVLDEGGLPGRVPGHLVRRKFVAAEKE